MCESLPGYDHWKTGGAMPHHEDRSNPYTNEDECPECGGEVTEGEDYWTCDECDWARRKRVPDDPKYNPYDEEQ